MTPTRSPVVSADEAFCHTQLNFVILNAFIAISFTACELLIGHASK
jgi:hypothetical protein